MSIQLIDNKLFRYKYNSSDKKGFLTLLALELSNFYFECLRFITERTSSPYQCNTVKRAIIFHSTNLHYFLLKQTLKQIIAVKF